MLTSEVLIDIVRQVSSEQKIDIDSMFSDLGIDSTGVVEILLELEVMYNIDVLDANLNVDEMVTLKHVLSYVNSLIS